jgi:hypothetical protein
VLTARPTFAVVAALLALLLRIVWGARRGDPFTLATVRRPRVLAVVTLAGGYLGFLVGFGLLAVAEVVKRGDAMRAGLETVV